MVNENQEELEKKEEYRAIALKNINSQLWGYALPKLISFENFGKLSGDAQQKYNALIQKVPSQEMYDLLFAPQLVSENGAVTSPYIQNSSLLNLQQSFAMLKVDDIAKYVGVQKDIKKSYKDKFITDLNEEETNTFIGLGMNYGAYQQMIELGGDKLKGITSGLEKLVCEEPKEENKK